MWHARLAQHYRHSAGVVAFGRFVQGCSSRSEAHAAGQDLTTLLGHKYIRMIYYAAAAGGHPGQPSSLERTSLRVSTYFFENSAYLFFFAFCLAIKPLPFLRCCFFPGVGGRVVPAPAWLQLSSGCCACVGTRAAFALARLQLSSEPARASMPVGLGMRGCLSLSLSSARARALLLWLTSTASA